MTAYATVEDLSARLSADGTAVSSLHDGELQDALDAAHVLVDGHCGRTFARSDTATARKFEPEDSGCLDVDDFWTTSGLVIATDTGDSGSYTTTWASTDYELEPANGIVNGLTGFPYTEIRAVGGLWFPLPRRREYTVQVTAKWGWENVPAPVKQATLLLAAETFKLREAPFGIAGFGEFGPVRIRSNPKVAQMLAPFCKQGGFGSPVVV